MGIRCPKDQKYYPTTLCLMKCEWIEQCEAFRGLLGQIDPEGVPDKRDRDKDRLAGGEMAEVSRAET